MATKGTRKAPRKGSAKTKKRGFETLPPPVPVAPATSPPPPSAPSSSAPPPAPWPAAPPTQTDPRTWGMLVHLAAFGSLVVPLGNILGPLVVWLIKKRDHPFIDQQGKESLNFQLSMTLYTLIAVVFFIALAIGGILSFQRGFSPFALMAFLPFLLVFAVLGLFNIVMVIIGAIQAYDLKPFQYPLRIPFVQ